MHAYIFFQTSGKGHSATIVGQDDAKKRLAVH
ncbi:unnamed protein product, partial [Rotaria socialis]